MPCNVHFLPAKAGDCIVLELDNNDCILIDGGYTSTYKQELKPLLLRLRDKGCRIVLMIVTHIDQDHIEGAIRLLSENGTKDNPQIIPIENIWFNGFFNTLATLPQFVGRQIEALSPNIRDQKKRILRDIQMQLPGEDGSISAQHSKCFEELCAENGYLLNCQFANATVLCASKTRKEVLQNGIQFGACKIYVLGPTESQLNCLAKELEVSLVKLFGCDYQLDEEFGKFFEDLMKLSQKPQPETQEIAALGTQLESWIGTSTMSPMNSVNCASIVVEIEYKGISMLFTGDSESEIWANLLAPHYQLIKLSHHGTTKPNLALLENTTGERLLISTNGGNNHRHPEGELLARAILKNNWSLYFNYRIAHQEQLLKLQEKYGFNPIFEEKEIIL